MYRILFFILFPAFAACSTVYLDQYQGKKSISLSATYSTEKNGIALAWSYPEVSVRIDVLRGERADNLQTIKTLLGQKDWLDDTAVVGADFFYRVEAFSAQGRLVASSDIVKGRRAYQDNSAPVPLNFRVDPGQSLSKIPLSWIGTEGQTYRLYRSLSAGSGYSEIAVTTKFFYEDTGLPSSKNYYYKLSVICQDAAGVVKEKFYSGGSSSIAGGAFVKGSTLSESL